MTVEWRVANVAWLILELAGVAKYLCAKDQCVGTISAKSLRVTEHTVIRVKQGLIEHFHRHDLGCVLFGASLRSLHRIIDHYVSHGHREYLKEAISLCTDEILESSKTHDSVLTNFERLSVHVGMRITPVKPEMKTEAAVQGRTVHRRYVSNRFIYRYWLRKHPLQAGF